MEWTVEKFALLQAAVDEANISVEDAAMIIRHARYEANHGREKGRVICPCGHTTFLRDQPEKEQITGDE